MTARQKSWLLALVQIAIALSSLELLRRELAASRFRDLVAVLDRLSWQQVTFALVLTLTGYLVLAGFDLVGLLYVDRPLRPRQTVLASLGGHAAGNTLGSPFIGGTPVRQRIYAAAGLTVEEVNELLSFELVSLWLGLLGLTGGLLVLGAPSLDMLRGLPVWPLRVIGLALLATVTGYVTTAALRRRPLILENWRIPVPSARIAIAQLLLSTLSWLIAAAVLFVLLPRQNAPPFLGFSLVFLLAQLAAQLSRVPGGLGVFEATMVLLLAPLVPASHALPALLAFRALYYLLPLAIALTTTVAAGMRRRQRDLARLVELSTGWLSHLVPSVLAVLVFLSGALLLLSNAAPLLRERLGLVERLLPLPVVELSHFLASVVGAALLVLARSLQRRLDAAFHLTTVLLAAAVALSLLKGLAWGTAVPQAIALGLLLVSRRHFYRRASLFAPSWSTGWTLAVILVVAASVWLGLFAYQHVDYRAQMWWEFSLRGDAPRTLRAAVGAAGILLLVGAARLLRPAPPTPKPPSAEETAIVKQLVSACPRTNATLAFLGDKQFLFEPERSAFVMYAFAGDSWVAMGDPVGSEGEYGELVWRFRELCDRFDARPVFYQVRPEYLEHYLDVGLSLFKLGESGHVQLPGLTLEGGKRKDLRQTRRRLSEAGFTFDLLPVETTPSVIPELRQISDGWMAEKNVREKRFSLGSFQESYLEHFPMAVIRQRERIVAFTNVLEGAGKKELSADLIRYRPDAPNGVMDFLFIELMLWGQREGYAWFSLGMTPLAGLEDHALAPLWSRIGAFLFRHGEFFYNFQGLRTYKEKFDPVWEPRYLACPDGLAVPRVLLDVASLIAGGTPGLVAR